jgi:uncharacterized protein
LTEEYPKDPKGFLGKGWNFPVQLSPSSTFNMSAYEEKVRQSILIILGTGRGERVMRPEFGCGIHDFVFESMNSSTIARMEASIREGLTQWEPRIEVISVNIGTEELDGGKIFIEVKYMVRATNNQFNIVYPFYLKEGG